MPRGWASINEPSNRTDDGSSRHDTPLRDLANRLLPPPPTLFGDNPDGMSNLQRVEANLSILSSVPDVVDPPLSRTDDIATLQDTVRTLQSSLDDLRRATGHEGSGAQRSAVEATLAPQRPTRRPIGRHERARAPRVERQHRTRVPSYLLALACDPSPPQVLAPARPSFVQLARPSPDPMLRYDNQELILPSEYLDTRDGDRALELLNPYQLDQVIGILGFDSISSIEEGQQDYVVEQIYQLGGTSREMWCVEAYAQHLRALRRLEQRRLVNPYERQEYADLMSGWEGARRQGWRSAERRREQYEAMMEELEQ